MFPVRKNWLSETVGKLQDTELYELFAEIYDYRKTGILKGEHLRAMDRAIAKDVTNTPAATMLRNIEDAILFEMARRYANEIELPKHMPNDSSVIAGDSTK